MAIQEHRGSKLTIILVLITVLIFHSECVLPGTDVLHTSGKSVCDLDSVDLGNDTTRVAVLNGNSTRDCPVEISVQPNVRLEFRIVSANISSTTFDYLYIDLMDNAAKSDGRIVAFSGLIQDCAIVLQLKASKIVLYARTDALMQLQVKNTKMINHETFVTDSGARGSCGFMKHHEKVVSCEEHIVPPGQRSYLYFEGIEVVCNPFCPVNCSCSLRSNEVAYDCPNGSQGSYFLTYPPEHESLWVYFFKSSDNDLTHLEMTVSQRFPWIRKLTITNTKLRDMTNDVFRGLDYMVTCDLSSNKITSIEPDVFRDMPNLQMLSLRGNQLTQIHRRTFHSLRYLQIVVLRENKLSELHPDVFRDVQYMYSLDLSENNFTTLPADIFKSLTGLTSLYLKRNDFATLHADVFKPLTRLKYLYLSYNSLLTIPQGLFEGWSNNLVELNLHGNSLSKLNSYMFKGLTNLQVLTLDANRLHWLDPGIWYQVPNLQRLNISHNSLHDLRRHVFNNLSDLVSLDLRFNHLRKIDKSSFVDFDNSTSLFVDDVPACCFTKTTKCIPRNPRPPFMTCKRLMPYGILRFFMWILGFAALFGNTFVIFWRCRRRKDSKVQPVQRTIIINLALADLLMGVYLLIIISADTHFGIYFPLFSEEWRTGNMCKFAGILSITSSEASVFFVTLISIDRFLGVIFPFKQYRISQRKVAVLITLMWTTALLLATIPTLLAGKYNKFYDMSQTCIGLPLIRQPLYKYENVTYIQDWTVGFHPEASNNNRPDVFLVSTEDGSESWMYFSVAVFLGLNLICCFIIFLCYLSIFLTVRTTTVNVGRYKERQSEELTMAIKMAVIVLTDFFCWVPVIILGILVQAHVITLSANVYAWVVVFVLPINSAVNPFLYTLVTAVVDRFDPSRRSSGYGSVPFKISQTRRTTLNSSSTKEIVSQNGTKDDPV